MYQFFVEPSQIQEKSVIISGTDVNHIKNVLRMEIGQKVSISDGIEQEYICEIAVMEQESINLHICSTVEENRELPSKIYLFQGLPKGDKMELIIQKAVELGVHEIIPVSMKRSVVKLDAKKEQLKRKRWQGISESAAKQSKRIVIPEIKPVMSFKEAILYGSQLEVKLLPYENEKGINGTKEIISSIQGNHSIGIFVGPEGGFDDLEVANAKVDKWQPISLGHRILRTETAGFTILSILMYHLETR
jgi:RNA methyltransferase, RsmE family